MNERKAGSLVSFTVCQPLLSFLKAKAIFLKSNYMVSSKPIFIDEQQEYFLTHSWGKGVRIFPQGY